jgi:hypothetical protein
MPTFTFNNKIHTYMHQNEGLDLIILTVKLGLNCLKEHEQRKYALGQQKSFVFGDSKSITALVYHDNKLTKRIIKNPIQDHPNTNEHMYPNWDEYEAKLLRYGLVVENPKKISSIASTNC